MTIDASKQTFMLRNKTFTYLLPLLGTDASHFKNCSSAFINKNEDFKIYLLFRTINSWFPQLEEWIRKQHLYDSEESINNEYKMYIFNIPEEYRRVYLNFRDGKYSKFDDEYKRHILRFHKEASKNSLESIKNVLYKGEDAYLKWEKELNVSIPRTQEIGSLPNMEQETFNLQMLT